MLKANSKLIGQVAASYSQSGPKVSFVVDKPRISINTSVSANGLKKKQKKIPKCAQQFYCNSCIFI